MFKSNAKVTNASLARITKLKDQRSRLLEIYKTFKDIYSFSRDIDDRFVLQHDDNIYRNFEQKYYIQIYKNENIEFAEYMIVSLNYKLIENAIINYMKSQFDNKNKTVVYDEREFIYSFIDLLKETIEYSEHYDLLSLIDKFIIEVDNKSIEDKDQFINNLMIINNDVIEKLKGILWNN